LTPLVMYGKQKKKKQEKKKKKYKRWKLILPDNGALHGKRKEGFGKNRRQGINGGGWAYMEGKGTLMS